MLGRGKRGQRAQVARVALQRVLGKPAFDAQMIEVGVDDVGLCYHPPVS